MAGLVIGSIEPVLAQVIGPGVDRRNDGRTGARKTGRRPAGSRGQTILESLLVGLVIADGDVVLQIFSIRPLQVFKDAVLRRWERKTNRDLKSEQDLKNICRHRTFLMLPRTSLATWA